MTKPSKIGIWTGAAAVFGALGLLPIMPASAADSTAADSKKDQTMEEVVVTGSYIKRDSFDSSSPITVVDQSQIANNATPNLGEVMVNQTFNYGSDFQTNTYAARPQIGTSTSANLRGLGANATLNLVDGKRTIQQDLNNSLPQIAIQRIDVLKDGASAIYGTDAVAGVVNIITRKNYSGAKFQAFYQQDSSNDIHEEVYDFMAGTDTDDGHITVAMTYRFRTALEQTERPQYLRNGFSHSTTGNPGTWRVPTRAADGSISGSQQLRDPGCGAATAQSPGGSDAGLKGNYLSGFPATSNGQPVCDFEFGETWNFINPDQAYSLWANYQFRITDQLANELDLQASRMITDSRGSPQNPGGRTEEFPIVKGTNPGNPFRAFSDLNGNGAVDPGEDLYAQDILDVNGNPVVGGDGIPDRSTTVDANGDGVNDVIVSATPFQPGGASNGIPFNEDVDVVALRILGKIGLLPDANQPDALHADGSNTGNATYDVINYRLADTLTYTVPDSTWEVDFTGIFQRNHLVLANKNSSQSALESGLRGQLKATQGYDYSYWNPFSTQALHCVDRACTYTGTPDYANTVDVLNAITIASNNVANTDFWSANLIATGDIMDLPAGTMGGAFGAEYRKESINYDVDSGRNQCDWHEGGCQYDWHGMQDVYSVFFELRIPIIENMEAQVAARFTDYGGTIGNSTDPKIAILYQPVDWLSLRASYSTAFIAPTLEQLNASEACGLQTMQDDLTNDYSGTFRVACVNSNPLLIPESADVWNVGGSISLLDGDLNIGLDYSEYKFHDRISETTANNVIRADYQNFLASGGNADPASGDVNGNGISDSADAWIAGPNSDPSIQRDSSGLVTRVKTSYVNAQSMLNRSLDLYGRYNLSLNNWGNLTFDLSVTQALEYSYNLGTGDPNDSGDGVGSQNEQVREIPPMPEFRVNGSVHWFLGNHAAMVRVRWMDSIQMEFNSAALLYYQGLINGTTTLESITYTDVNYKYTFPKLIGDRETTIEVGANNVFDELPTPFFNLGGIETFLHDVRGRMVYVRVNQDI